MRCASLCCLPSSCPPRQRHVFSYVYASDRDRQHEASQKFLDAANAMCLTCQEKHARCSCSAHKLSSGWCSQLFVKQRRLKAGFGGASLNERPCHMQRHTLVSCNSRVARNTQLTHVYKQACNTTTFAGHSITGRAQSIDQTSDISSVVGPTPLKCWRHCRCA